MIPDSTLVSGLFSSGAITVSPPQRPFWRSIGRLTAIKLRMPALLGGVRAQTASSALAQTAVGSPLLMTGTLLGFCQDALNTARLYALTVEKSVEFITRELLPMGINCVASSPHNGWLFSLPVAQNLGLAHVMIMDNKQLVRFFNGRSEIITSDANMRALVIADVIGGGRTFYNPWLEAISDVGGRTVACHTVTDRRMGGSERLISDGIACGSLCDIDDELFDCAAQLGAITAEQAEFAKRYIADPVVFMNEFMLQNPDFVKRSLEGDEQERAAAQQCIERGYYTLKKE